MKAATTSRLGFWNRSHHLDRMTFRELVVAYFQYYAIQGYLLLAAVSIGLSIWKPAPLVPTIAAAAAAVVVYPLVWYVLHRFVLHSKWMWKFSFTARTWKRIHFDHHQDPNHLEILFGALYTTLPAIAVATIPIGWAIGGFGGAAAALASGLLTTCFYEFCHCIQHLAYKPKAKWLQDMKTRHMAHHYHDETGNFGITNFYWDKLFDTFYEGVHQRQKSPTVYNLGYTYQVAERFPHVLKLSNGVITDHPRERLRG